jgi:DNA-binding transcriptional LysR family regulator
MIHPAPALPFDLRGLEVFLAVCEAGSMALAARRLGITQPSVSQAVAETEARLRVTLFDRRVRPIALTPAGAALRQRASALLAEARGIPPLLHQVAQGRVALLRVGLVDSLGRALSGPLAGFLAEAAEQSALFSGLTATHAKALLERQVDIFLGAEDVADIEGLERHLLREEEYILLLPRGTARPDSLADLVSLGCELPFIRFSARSRTGVEIERHLRRLRISLPRRQEFDTPLGVASAVAAGLGWALSTPLCLREAGLPADALDRAALPGPSLRRHLVLVARQRELRSLPERMAAFCRTILAREAN